MNIMASVYVLHHYEDLKKIMEDNILPYVLGGFHLK